MTESNLLVVELSSSLNGMFIGSSCQYWLQQRLFYKLNTFAGCDRLLWQPSEL